MSSTTTEVPKTSLGISQKFLGENSGIIGVDIDDTLYSFRDLAVGILSEMAADNPAAHQAIYTKWDQWRTPYDILGDTWLEVIRRSHDDEMILSQRPYPEAVQTLCRLSDKGHDLIYISNRATETYDATFSWLRENEFPLGMKDDLICTKERKLPLLVNCQCLIDDRTRTLVEFVTDSWWSEWYGLADRRMAFGLMKDYNHNLTDVPGIYLAPTWTGIAQFMETKGLI